MDDLLHGSVDFGNAFECAPRRRQCCHHSCYLPFSLQVRDLTCFCGGGIHGHRKRPHTIMTRSVADETLEPERPTSPSTDLKVNVVAAACRHQQDQWNWFLFPAGGRSANWRDTHSQCHDESTQHIFARWRVEPECAETSRMPFQAGWNPKDFLWEVRVRANRMGNALNELLC